MQRTTLAALMALSALAACSNTNDAAPTPAFTTFAAVGDSAAVATEAGLFRTALGGSLNAPGVAPQDSGRREINWDGVPAALTNIDTFPATFFNVNSKRGALFTGIGTGFRIDSSAFVDVNGSYPAQFKAFSPKKLFMPVGSNTMEVYFNRSGLATPGLVNGFGVIFSDVDRTGSTRIDFFDKDQLFLGSVTAPALAGAHGFSFVGAVFPASVVSHVFIVSGDSALSGTTNDISIEGTKDLVAMDDFIYGEPRLVP
ncbi:MAG: hypothetical protein JF590_00915 [Gemmatimonadetes bacterium]|nr:hypothetical protein [Gemmatimonadota bacterium]